MMTVVANDEDQSNSRGRAPCLFHLFWNRTVGTNVAPQAHGKEAALAEAGASLSSTMLDEATAAAAPLAMSLNDVPSHNQQHSQAAIPTNTEEKKERHNPHKKNCKPQRRHAASEENDDFVDDVDDLSHRRAPPVLEIHCPDKNSANDDAKTVLSTVSSITRATSVPKSRTKTPKSRFVPSTIDCSDGVVVPVPIGAVYQQSQGLHVKGGNDRALSSETKRALFNACGSRVTTTKPATSGSNRDRSGRPSQEKNGGGELVSNRPSQEKKGTNELATSRPCRNKETKSADDSTGIVKKDLTMEKSTLEQDVECNDLATDTAGLAVASLVTSPSIAATTCGASLSQSQHEAQLAAEAARDEFRHQVRSEMLKETVRAEPMSERASTLTPTALEEGTDINRRNNAGQKLSPRAKVISIIVALLLTVAIAATVGATLRRHASSGSNHGAAAAPDTVVASRGSDIVEPSPDVPEIVYLDDGRQAFTSTQQLYDAVDDYLQTNKDDDEVVVNSSMTTAALTYGYPIGTWDVSRLSDFSKVFCPNRNQKLDGTTRFAQYSSLNEDLSAWNVANAVTMHGMFVGCADYVGEGLERWDTSRVQDFSFMLLYAGAFSGNVSAWNTSRATTMTGMFGAAAMFNGDLTRWDVSQVVSMRFMFSSAYEFRGRGLATWNTHSVLDMSSMFNQAFIDPGTISAWNTTLVQDMSGMFMMSAFNDDLSRWNVERVTHMQAMFAHNPYFQGIGLESWNTSRVTSIKGMFDHASAFEGDLSRWDVGLVTDFSLAFSHASIFNSDLSSWNVSNAQDLSGMFASAQTFNQSLCSWALQLQPSANVDNMFNEASACQDTSTPIMTGNLSVGPFCHVCA